MAGHLVGRFSRGRISFDAVHAKSDGVGPRWTDARLTSGRGETLITDAP